MSPKLELFADLGWETSPAHLVFDRRGHLFVACDLTSTVIELDAWGAVRRRYEIAPGKEFGINVLLAASSGMIWAASSAPAGLRRISPADGTVAGFPLDYGSEPSALVESFGSVFCATAGYGTIVEVGRGGSLAEPFAVLPRNSEPIALTTDSRGQLYAAQWQTGAISRISPDTGSVAEVARLPAGTLPFGMTHEYRGSLFVIASRSIFRLDVATGVLEQTLELPRALFRPCGLAEHRRGFSVTGDGGLMLSVDPYALSRSRVTDFGDLRLLHCASNDRGDLFVADYSSGRIFRADP